MAAAGHTRSGTYEMWKALAEHPPRVMPERLGPDGLRSLGTTAREEHDEARRIWHANILIRTPQVDAVHTQLWDILDSNLQDADRVKGAAAIDAPPSLGKSTAALTFGYQFHQQQIRRHGEYLDGGQTLHLPVCRVTLAGRMTTKGLNEMILRFYAHPAAAGNSARNITGPNLAAAAAECVDRHRTQLVFIDDVHFLNMNTVDGVEVSNQLKWLANEYPATFLFAGVGLENRGLLSEGMTVRDLPMAQTARRWTLLPLEPFRIDTSAGRESWRTFLLGVERDLVLAHRQPGLLADELAEYLFARSTGMIGSLMDLVRRGASRAIRTGDERLSRELLDSVSIDHAAETARTRVAAEFSQRRAAKSRNKD